MTKVIVTSTVDLTATQLDAVKKAVVKKYGPDVSIESKIDASILGGVQITIGSRQLDGSLKGKLDQIRKKFVQNS